MNKKTTGKMGEFRDRLNEVMQERGMRAIDLSEKTNIPKSMISYYLSGRAVPKADRMYLLAHTLQVTEAWLMGYDVPKYSEEEKPADQQADGLSELDREIIERFSRLTDSQKMALAAFLQTLEAGRG